MRLLRSPYALFTAVLLWSLSALAAEPLTGTWMAQAEGERLMLNLRGEQQRGTMGLTIPRSAFQGLSTPEGDTSFRLVREAGTLHFEGRFADNKGAGHYRFEPNPTFLQEMKALGYTKLEPEEQLHLALFDLGPARVRALAELGFTKIPHEQLLQVGIFRVTPDYVLEIRNAGYPDVTLQQLIELRIHAIDADFIRSLSGNNGGGRK